MEEKIIFGGRRSGKTLEMEKELRKLPYKITYTKKAKKMMEEEKIKRMIDKLLDEEEQNKHFFEYFLEKNKNRKERKWEEWNLK